MKNIGLGIINYTLFFGKSRQRIFISNVSTKRLNLIRQLLNDSESLRSRKTSLSSKLFQLSLKHRSFKLIFNALSKIIETNRIYLSLNHFKMFIESRHILINLFDLFKFQCSISLFYDFFSFRSINRDVLAFYKSSVISIAEFSVRFKNRTFCIKFSSLGINICNLRNSAHTSKSSSTSIDICSRNRRIAAGGRSSSTGGSRSRGEASTTGIGECRVQASSFHLRDLILHRIISVRFIEHLFLEITRNFSLRGIKIAVFLIFLYLHSHLFSIPFILILELFVSLMITKQASNSSTSN